MQQMVEGDMWEMYIPSDHAYVIVGRQVRFQEVPPLCSSCGWKRSKVRHSLATCFKAISWVDVASLPSCVLGRITMGYPAAHAAQIGGVTKFMASAVLGFFVHQMSCTAVSPS